MLSLEPMKNYLILLAATIVVVCSSWTRSAGPGMATTKPNIIMVMTDDQGIGDFGFMGNPYVKTPHLDSLAAHSLNLTNFYVSPVCAPTRASLMTGRYSERTGVYDTYNGGAIMSSEEITLAEVLRDNGYRTGIFGKWHLGDNHPYRPMDQGFEISLVHRGGGIGQPGDALNFFARDSSYFDPVLFSNGNPVETSGYCSDVFTDGLIEFVRQEARNPGETPFFAYLSFNAPHTPLQLPKAYYDMYADLEFDVDSFAVFDEAVQKMTPDEMEAARRVYGMVTNIDDNVGRLVQTLKDEDIYDQTSIIFLTDNGPQQNRFKIGLRGRKSHVYGGGVRVPCMIHYPTRFLKKEKLDTRIAHIDLLPSILDLCGLEKVNHKIDGLSFLSSETANSSAFDHRTLFFEWGRGFLQKYRNFAALKGEYKLVGNTGPESTIEGFELFNINKDPREMNNVLTSNTRTAIALKKEMDAWYDEIVSEENSRKNFPALIGTPNENPVLLNRNDAKGTPVAWNRDHVLNYWDVTIAEDGIYNIAFHFMDVVQAPGKMCLKMYPYNYIQDREQYTSEWTFEGLAISAGNYRVEPYYQSKKGKFVFPLYLSVERADK